MQVGTRELGTQKGLLPLVHHKLGTISVIQMRTLEIVNLIGIAEWRVGASFNN